MGIGLTEDKIKASFEAAKGINPCKNCERRPKDEITCYDLNCTPWILYFKQRWTNIRKNFLKVP